MTMQSGSTSTEYESPGFETTTSPFDRATAGWGGNLICNSCSSGN